MKRNKNRHINSLKIIGNNIKSQRLKKNISQEELAFKLNSARNYIGCIERAEKQPSIPFLLDIANVLECKIETFFNGI